VVLEILSRGKMADLIPEDWEKLFERQALSDEDWN